MQCALGLRIRIWVNANRFDPLSHKYTADDLELYGFIWWLKSQTHAHTSPCCWRPTSLLLQLSIHY